MEDFANYSNHPKKGANANQSSDWEKELKQAAARYNGKNEAELLRDIFARAQAGKKDGTLTNEQIDAFYQQISPMLDSSKRKKLQKLLLQLKSM